MNDTDFKTAAALLDLVAKCAAIGPMYNSIAGEANEELKVINEECKENAKERAAQIEADRLATEAARLRETEEYPDRPRPTVRPNTIYPEGSGVGETPNPVYINKTTPNGGNERKV